MPVSDIHTTSHPGLASGLHLELFAGMPGINDLLSPSQGFYIVVNDNSKEVKTRYHGNTISVGQMTNIGVKRDKVKRLSEPYSNCTFEINPDTVTETTDREVFGIFKLISRGGKINFLGVFYFS